MKIFVILFSWFMMVSDLFSMSESLEKLLRELHLKHPFVQETIRKSWPGLESEEGLNEILDLVLQPGRNENYPEGMNILEIMRFPKEKIVGIILEKIKGRNDYESGLNRGFGLLQDYTDDSRVFPYLIGFINDNRPMGRREYTANSDYHSIAFRISDCAASVICHGLKNRGLIKTGDPAWGEPGGATSYEKADKALGFLKELLIQNQLMTVEQASARPKNDTKTSDSLSKDTPQPSAQARELKRPDIVSEPPRRIVPWLWIGACVFTLFGFVFWRAMKRRS